MPVEPRWVVYTARANDVPFMLSWSWMIAWIRSSRTLATKRQRARRFLERNRRDAGLHRGRGEGGPDGQQGARVRAERGP
jgi:hypothetical protein